MDHLETFLRFIGDDEALVAADYVNDHLLSPGVTRARKLLQDALDVRQRNGSSLDRAALSMLLMGYRMPGLVGTSAAVTLWDIWNSWGSTIIREIYS